MASSLTQLQARLCAYVREAESRLRNDLDVHVNLPTGPGGGALDESRERFTRRLEKLGAEVELIAGDAKPAWLMGEGESSDVVPPLAVCRNRREGDKAHVLLCGHLDTVHPGASAFRNLEVAADGKRATGPGCVDMKGGLVIAVAALEALSACGIDVSWTFMFNSDEETGSYHSDRAMRAEAASGYTAGLVFEPAMADGGLVVERPGSGQFLIETFGKAGHVGRDFKNCISAVTALGECIVRVGAMADPDRGAIVNIGPLKGGTATNIVPDHAAAWGNVRFETPAVAEDLGRQLDALATGSGSGGGGGAVSGSVAGVKVQRSFHRPSKPLTAGTQKLAELARDVAEGLGQKLPFGKTGGVCDGNNMQAAGLATIDTLGVRGGGLHTVQEWIEMPSLVERCQLLAVLMARLAAGEGR